MLSVSVSEKSALCLPDVSGDGFHAFGRPREGPQTEADVSICRWEHHQAASGKVSHSASSFKLLLGDCDIFIILDVLKKFLYSFKL